MISGVDQSASSLKAARDQKTYLSDLDKDCLRSFQVCPLSPMHLMTHISQNQCGAKDRGGRARYGER